MIPTGPARPSAPPPRQPRLDPERKLTLQHRWIQVRLLGWLLIGAWQVLGLASEFIPIDLNRRGVRIAGRILGILGLVLVAYGFERLMRLTHDDDKRESRWVWRTRRVKRGAGGRRKPG